MNLLNIYNEIDNIRQIGDPLPCPFCGSDPVVYKKDNGTFEVRCANEYCGVIVMTDEKITKALAIKTWNTRAKVNI